MKNDYPRISADEAIRRLMETDQSEETRIGRKYWRAKMTAEIINPMDSTCPYCGVAETEHTPLEPGPYKAHPDRGLLRQCRACAGLSTVSDIRITPMDTEELPALTGSEKQVDWASEIRRGAFAAIDALAARGLAQGQGIDLVEEALGKYRQILALPTDSHWWIDNRGGGGLYLLQAATSDFSD